MGAFLKGGPLIRHSEMTNVKLCNCNGSSLDFLDERPIRRPPLGESPPIRDPPDSCQKGPRTIRLNDKNEKDIDNNRRYYIITTTIMVMIIMMIMIMIIIIIIIIITIMIITLIMAIIMIILLIIVRLPRYYRYS